MSRRRTTTATDLFRANPALAARHPDIARQLGVAPTTSKAPKASPAPKRTPRYAAATKPATLPVEIGHVPGPEGRLRVFIPGLYLVSEHNRVRAEHHFVSHRRIAAQHALIASVLARAPRPEWSPLSVVMTRWGGRALDQNGNLQSSTKAVQDAIATWLGIDDRDAARVAYETRQAKRPRGVAWRHAVEIVFAPRAPGEFAEATEPEGGPTR